MDASQVGTTEPRWGTEIVVEDVGGIPYRLYAERPKRLEHLLALAPRWGAQPHIVQGDRVLSFDDLIGLVDRKTSELVGLGIGGGDRVFLMGWNSPDYVVNYWAVLKAGGVPVLVNTWWSEAEVADALELLAPVLVLADARCATKIPGGWATGSWETSDAPLAEPVAGPALIDENAPGVIIFTSGTSGKPKAVVLSHRALLSNLQMLLVMSKRLPHQSPSPDVALHTGPLFHIGGAQAMLRAVTVGNTLVMPRGRFDPGELLELVETWKINRWSAVPTMISRVLEHPGIGSRDLSSLKAVTLGGALLHPDLQQRIRTGLPGAEARIATGYGLSENGGQATAASDGDTVRRPGTSGRALPLTEVKIVPRAGLPDGEIVIRAPTQMSEYYGVAETPIDAEGWLATGDLGKLDDDGYLWITGRSKELIIRGGENVAPAAVERALVAAPAVREAVVFGLPHADLGEEVAAVVVIEPGASQDAIRQAVRATLASFSVPSWWRFQEDALPVNATGKIDKAAVIAEARAAVTTG
ncbi:acyl--CoA ligase [Sphingomonas ginsenosidivorax]|uniref:Acyl--CoA ligase n=1 Tax=Sphingomonas ginsenosidivorax TaxID=862135 RepID=A0A5C6UGK2_9SPHN|nr:class I adenylate-forming enzyme family protein [Sphingomonas ginsenosidivorax]TXC71078.1 acyl--CoA ligase [Sphingomonas ginsenosidivorax]